MDMAHRAFVQKTIDLSRAPTTTAYTMRRVSLYEELWKMPTPESMTRTRIAASTKTADPFAMSSPYFRLPVPWRALAPHAGYCWWEAIQANPAHNIKLIRQTMLDELPSAESDDGVQDVTDSEQMDEDISNDDDDQPTTPFPLLSAKSVHIVAYGWDSKLTTFYDIIDAIESLQFPLTEELEPKKVAGVTKVDIHLSCMDTFTWALLQLRTGWIVTGTTGILISFRISVGDAATTGKLHAWCSLTAVGRDLLQPRNIPYTIYRT
jgi:hypothetical protein